MMEEIWKPIKEFPGYDVSNLGRVRTYRTRGKNGGVIRDTPQQIRKLQINSKGYHIVSLTKEVGKRASRVNVYQLVAHAFLGPQLPGLLVCHNDDNPINDTVTNLRYDTNQNNQLDAVRHGRYEDRKNLAMKHKRKLGMDVLKILLATG